MPRMQTFLKYLLFGALLIGAWLRHDQINTIFFVAWGRVEEVLGLRPPLERPTTDAPSVFPSTPAPGSAAPVTVTGPVDSPASLPPATPTPPQTLAIPLTPLPENVWLIKERVSIMTDTGVRGVEPGTLVDLIRKEVDHWVVSDGEGEFDVKPSQVTQDRSFAASTPNAPSPPVAAPSGDAPAPVQIDPHASERRMLEQRIITLKRTLATQSKQLDELVRANPRAYTLGRATTPEAQQLVNAIQQTKQQLVDAQAKLKSLPPPPPS